MDMCLKKTPFSYMCNCICNLLYEYEWMKNTNILYVHHMYNMSHVTRCFMQLNQKSLHAIEISYIR